jgi:23S rRNA U2552 (ribose-2'-O)-methylase RlmE/FtsJ
MDSTGKEKPWDNITLFTCNDISIFELDSKNIEHIKSEEELVLHKYRNRINDYEKILPSLKNWEYYKKVVNPYELIYTQKKYDNFPKSIYRLKPLSRSYFKMVEMLELINFFSMDNIRSAHVCEGPGGFIEALFDEAYKKNKKMISSVAMTLKSKQSNVPGWKRATQFLKKNKCIRILYGEDDTGNIMKPVNQQYFIDSTEKTHIFTADGGFDFSYDYENQEQLIFPLLIASTKIGLEVLKKGGVFILKLFDFYHKATVDLLYFLSCHFKEWTLYKPATSRPCNPEHYFIGKGFTGCTDEVLDIMRLWCSIIENKKLESLLETPVSFNVLINEVRQKSFKSQTEYLEKVFNMIDKNDEELIKSCLKNNEISSYEWCIRFKVPTYIRGFN